MSNQSQQAPSGPKPCPQDCTKCDPWQQLYCSTKMVYSLSAEVKALRTEVASLTDDVKHLKSSIPPISDSFIEPTQ